MPSLPDRFDLSVIRAREEIGPDRQADFLLGGMMALPHWFFLNLANAENPLPCTLEADEQNPGDRHLLVFTDLARLEILAGELNLETSPPPAITLYPAEALPWILRQPVAGLFVNPGEYAFLLPMDQITAYHAAWAARGGEEKIGFWIPNMTSEEEDFWQEHGL